MPGRNQSGPTRVGFAVPLLVVGLLLIGWSAWHHGDRHGWHATARVRVEPPSGLLRSGGYNPHFLQDFFKSATNHLTDPAVCSEIARQLGIPPGGFRFLGIEQYRSTRIVELRFSGRSAPEVASAARVATDYWRRALQFDGFPVKSENVDPVTTQTAFQARWTAIRHWTYRIRYSLGWP